MVGHLIPYPKYQIPRIWVPKMKRFVTELRLFGYVFHVGGGIRFNTRVISLMILFCRLWFKDLVVQGEIDWGSVGCSLLQFPFQLVEFPHVSSLHLRVNRVETHVWQVLQLITQHPWINHIHLITVITTYDLASSKTNSSMWKQKPVVDNFPNGLPHCVFPHRC